MLDAAFSGARHHAPRDVPQDRRRAGSSGTSSKQELETWQARAVSDATARRGASPVYTPEVIEDIQVKAELGRYRIRGFGTLRPAAAAHARRPHLHARVA